jgi:hypothetical protein
MKIGRNIIMLSLIALGATHVSSGETITYTYDAKGRLVKVVRTGTVNNNVQTTYTHDKANNRKTATTSGSTNPSQVPPPPPQTTNLPPVANADAVSVQCNVSVTKNVVANDTDPENNVPLSVQSASTVSGTAFVTIASSTSLAVTGGTVAGTSQATYVVADSLGATAVGTLNITTTGTAAQCLQ